MKDVIESIKKSVFIYGMQHWWGDELPAESNDTISRLFMKIPGGNQNTLLPFLQNQVGFRIEWRWGDPEWVGLNACGQIRFPGVERLLEGDPGTGMKPYGKGYENLLWSKKKNRGWDARFDQFLMIDDLGLGNAVLLDPANETLYLWLFNTGAFPLKLELSRYFETAFRFRGLYLWQKFFLVEGTQLPENLILIHHLQIPRLFPDLADYVEDLPVPAYLLISKDRNYEEQINGMDDRLSDLGADINDGESNYGSSLQAINKVIQSHGLQFDPELLAYFVSAGTTKEDWEFTLKDGTKTGGTFTFFGLDEMFGGPKESRAKNVDWDFCTFKFFGFGKDEEKSEMYQRFFKDRTMYWEAYCQVLLVPDEHGRLHLEIMYDVDEISAYPVSFPTFVDKLIATCGMSFWAYHLAPKWLDLKFHPFEGPLKEVFPDIDTEGFQFHS